MMDGEISAIEITHTTKQPTGALRWKGGRLQQEWREITYSLDHIATGARNYWSDVPIAEDDA